VDPHTFRTLMSAFPTGVAVVTTIGADGTPRGLTCSALCSLSVDPPLILVCLRNGSGTLAGIRSGRTFGVNFLHHGGRETAELFASAITDRFDRVPWKPTSRTAMPALHDCAHSVAECTLTDEVVAGDHTILIGEVVSVEVVSDDPPLLYGRRRYAAWPADVAVSAE
jgi:flavin reductase (DIM6/NTAB) family NADH-FMN oxidoreductase RutF